MSELAGYTRDKIRVKSILIRASTSEFGGRLNDDPDGHGDINQYVSVWRDVLYDLEAQAREADDFIDLLARLQDPSGYDASLEGFAFNDLLVRAYAPPAYAGA
jgi:hypothetical protein